MKPHGPKKTVKGMQPGISAEQSSSSLQSKAPGPRGSGGPQTTGPSSSGTNSSAIYRTTRGFGHSHLTPRMSLDRSVQRDMSPWDQAGAMFNQDHYSGDSYGSGRQDGLYTDFSQDWANPWEVRSYPERNRYRWQNAEQDWQQGPGSWSREGPFGGGSGDFREAPMPEAYSHQGSDSWRSKKPKPVRTQPPINRKGRQSAPQNRWVRAQGGSLQNEGEVRESGSMNNRWNHFTKQFGNSHFHRENVDSTEGEFGESDGSLRAAQADSLGLDDSGSSGGGKKRPRPLDREGQLSKSSRAENSTNQSGFSSPNSSRALSLSDLNGGQVQKPDMTSKQGRVQKGQAGLLRDPITKTSTGLSVKAAGVAGKKKQLVLKHKAAGASSGSKAADRMDKVGEQQGGEGSGEGVLERAERMCQELREKRQQAAHLRSASSGQRVATLRNALNTSVRRFNSAHKSFIRGYLSDSGSTSGAVTDGCGTPASATPKKHFSSSCEPRKVTQTGPKIAAVTAGSQDGQPSEAAPSSVASTSSQLSDIERIRHSIENSVMAEGRTPKLNSREGSLLGNRSPGASISRSAVRALSTSAGSASASSVGKKPPLPLSKDALAKMVKAPRTRTQRVQLARMLRQHTSSAMTRSRRIQLDGLYDSEDSDSIQDVLKNISGLDEIGDCAELKNIKLEDLTNEDKLRIAQLIEEIDRTDRDCQPSSNEYGAGIVSRRGPPLSNSCRGNCAEPSDREAEMSDQSDHPRSLQRQQTASPAPSRPLSLDDLHTESSQQEALKVHSPSVQTSTLMRSPSPRPTPVHSHAQSPSRPVPACPPSPSGSTGAARDDSEIFVDSSAVPDVVHTTTQLGGRISPEFRSGRDADHRLCSSPQRSPIVPMEVSDEPDPGNCSVAGGILPSRSIGVLHEVTALCREQDAAVAEMRNIDVELSQMYKSLIEIVARMSGLQRRRVQLQAEGEQLSQRRNHLLSGLVPNAGISLGSRSQFTREDRQPDASLSSSPPVTQKAGAEGRQVKESTTEPRHGNLSQSSAGSSVTLPSWLTAPSPSPSSNSQPMAERSEPRQKAAVSTPSGADQTSDVCLSGSITSSIGSNTPLAVSQNALFGGSLDNAQEVGDVQDRSIRLSSGNLNSRPSSAGSRVGRGMLSINSVVEMNRKGDDGSEMEMPAPLASAVSVEASQHGVKNSVGADSSSGIGSSILTRASSEQKSGLSVPEDHSQQCSSSTQSSVSSSLGQQLGPQPGCSQAAGPGQRLIFNTLGSPQSTGACGMDVPKSPGISVAYLGALSSDLVQQIVRSLPFTSQLGEVGGPSMYMLKPGASLPENSAGNHPADVDVTVRSMASSVDTPEVKSRVRTSSVLSMSSVASDLSSGEQALSASVPPLKLPDGSEKGGSKTCTPRSESDAHSVTSGTSLGEQIKLFSERNTSSQGTASSLSSLSYIGASAEDGKESRNSSLKVMPNCSVILERLDLESGIQQARRTEDEDADRPKKRKTKKDRNQSLQRRRRFVVDSSSEGEEDGEEAVGIEDGLPGTVSSAQQCTSSALLDRVELMEADCKSEEGDLDTTLVDSGWQLSQEAMSEEEVSSSQASSSLAINPSQLRLNPENLKAFRANVRRSLTTTAATDSSAESAQKSNPVDSTVTKKDNLKICGPCAPVMGLQVHGSLLYVCFQGIGVNSYTMEGQLSGEYSMSSAQCFAITPTGSGSQHHVAVGGEDRLTFLSTSDQSVVSSLDTVLKVMCVLAVDTSLFVGLDCGSIVVVSLTTLQETRRFQASDMAIHSMTWTREGSTRLLCIASQDSHIHIIDAASGLPVRIIGGHTKTAFSLCMLEHFVLSGSGDRKVMAHNVHTAVQDWELNDHKGIITSVCVDNGLLFSAGYDKIIRCYDLKSLKLLHLIYGAGKSIVMKMMIHKSMLYTGNRDGQVEAVDLRDMGSFACECVSCPMVYGLKEHLWHHLVADHLLPNAQAMRCPWSNCFAMLDTGSALVKAGEHMRNHINCS